MPGNVFDEGLKGTDNCPICGQAMDRTEYIFCGLGLVVLVCNTAGDTDIPPHRVQVSIPKWWFSKKEKGREDG